MAKSEIYVRTQSQTFAQTPDNLRKYIRVARTIRKLSTLEIEEGEKNGRKTQKKKLFNSYLTLARMQNECRAFVQTKAMEFMYGYSFKKRKKREKLNLKLHQKIRMGNLSHPPVHSRPVERTIFDAIALGKITRCERGLSPSIYRRSVNIDVAPILIYISRYAGDSPRGVNDAQRATDLMDHNGVIDTDNGARFPSSTLIRRQQFAFSSALLIFGQFVAHCALPFTEGAEIFSRGLMQRQSERVSTSQTMCSKRRHYSISLGQGRGGVAFDVNDEQSTKI